MNRRFLTNWLWRVAGWGAGLILTIALIYALAQVIGVIGGL